MFKLDREQVVKDGHNMKRMDQRKEYLNYVNTIYKAIVDKIDVGVHAIDRTGKTVIYNKKMMELEAMDEEDVMHKHLQDVFMFKEGQDSTLVKALKEGKETRNVKQTYYNNRGREITTINNTFPIIIDGEVQGAIEIAQDVTKLERLMKENRKINGSLRYTFDKIIGKSETIKQVIENAKRASRTSSNILIIGETGTGKELFAQSIHHASDRFSGPFISQNCAALPENLIESLLFGTKKGAFTGSIDQPGLFEQANGGTLLLDEINSLNLNLQAKLLRAIQERTIRRLGDTKDIPIDVRIIANMNENPVEAIKNNRLREDLYYRLGVVTLFLPPLRERKEDIPLLVQRFIEKFNDCFQMKVKGLAKEVMQTFQEYDWYGNVRELEHIIEASMNLMRDEEKLIRYEHLPFQYRSRMFIKKEKDLIDTKMTAIKKPIHYNKTLKEQLDVFEKAYIEQVLQDNDYNITKTAATLGLSRQSLQYRIKKLSINTKKGNSFMYDTPI